MSDLPAEHRSRVERAIATLGWSAANLRFLAKGASNAIYAFETEAGPKVAKVSLLDGPGRLHREEAFLRLHPGIGPGCDTLWTDPRDGSQVLVQERLEGHHPFFLDEAGVEAMGRVVRRYHDLRAPEGVEREDWLAFLEARVLTHPDPGAPVDLTKALARALPRARGLGERLAREAPSGPPVPVHGDLIPLNLMVTPQGIRVLDWEGLRLDEPEADVATFLKSFRCGERERDAFTRGYGPGLDPRRLAFRRLLHELQVAGWRLACQVPVLRGEALDKALREAGEELASAAAALDRMA